AFVLRGKTAREAGTALSADAMVEGTVGKVDGRLRVTISLVNVTDEAVLWSQRYDVTEKDLYALQDSAAVAIASALHAGVARRDGLGLAAHRTTNPEAHDLVLRGQFLVEQTTEAAVRQAIALFERAAALDPTYADPWNGIAQGWYFLADTYLAPRVALPPMRAAIEKALLLDPTSAWAHALKGSMLVYSSDHAAAEREFLVAAALDSTTPLLADYAWRLHARGLDDSAATVLRRARRHNPFSFEPLNASAAIFSDRRMLDSASAACEALVQIVANDDCRQDLLIEGGRASEAVTGWRANPPTTATGMLSFATALAASGDSIAARRQLAAGLAAAGSHYIREDMVAAVYLSLGDTVRTLEWLERGVDAQAANMSTINRIWQFTPLHGNPRFDAIVRKVGLQPWR
ncbi:MAG: hypothetical protein H0U85_07700, partial [Gemmatimonadales bacterium]|nr:hypothetical protein [Gemmatimonadales bacterium]